MTTSPFDATIQKLLKIEGGYVNDPADLGGETNFGITSAVAKANGYSGPMKDLTREKALDIYRNIYWLRPKFDQVAALSPSIAAECFDTGVNLGVYYAVSFLNRGLNALREDSFPGVFATAEVSTFALQLLKAFLAKRGDQGEHVLLKALNCLQGERYIELTEKRQQNHKFIYGWLANRVDLSPS